MKTSIYFLPFALFFFLQLFSTSLTTVGAHCPPCPACPPCPGTSSHSNSQSPPSDSTSTPPSGSSSQTPPNSSPPKKHQSHSNKPSKSKSKAQPPSSQTPSGSSPPTPPSASSSQNPLSSTPPTPSSSQSPPTPSSSQSPPDSSPPSSSQSPPDSSTPSSDQSPPSSSSDQSPPSSSSDQSPPSSSSPSADQSPPSSSTPSSSQSPPTPSSSQSPPTPSSSQSPPTPSSSQSPPTPSSSQSSPPAATVTTTPAPPIVEPNSSAPSTLNPMSPPNSPSTPSLTLGFSFKGSFSKVFAFGGSYTDTGNAQAMGALSQNFLGPKSPYGITGFGKPANRMCDGRLVLDFLCDSLSLPSPQPYKSVTADFSAGVNFALAGSTSLSSDFFAKYKIGQNLAWKMHMSVKMQIDWFNTYYQQVICKGQNPCKPDFENALFWIGEIGVNDYSRSFKTSISMQMLTDSCILHITQLLMTLLQNGAKYIVVQGLPPVGCLASDVSLCPIKNLDKMGCVTIINSAIMMHNQILQKKIEGFQKQYPDRSIVYGDYWNAYMTILMNPAKYQIQEPFKACCGAQDGLFNFNQHSFCGFPGTTTCQDPSKYVNWDGIHLTEAMHKHITQLLLHEGFCHPSFDTLVKKKLGA